MLLRSLSTLALAAPVLWSFGPAQAQTLSDTVIVFDGSGSMRGQIDGRPKIEIARETLSSVLSETAGDMRMGMIAYGHTAHRRERDCADIETMVPLGSASRTVPAMIAAANGLTPQGMTPLSEAVRRAAEEMLYTEVPATVVLITDGIETCEADPCALAVELEEAGIDFTAHVVGFGLSDEEGRQVACLAENTGGLYIQASDSGELADALRRTIEVSEKDFQPAEREVHFLLRDSEDGPLLHGNDMTVLVETADGEPVDPAAFAFDAFAINGRTAAATLEPGDYRLLINRDAGSFGGYRTALDVTVPPGEGVHTVEASLTGVLVLNAFINPTMPFDPADPPASSIKGAAWAYFEVFPVIEGEVAETPVVQAWSDLRFPLPAGQYLVRANLDRTLAAERSVEVGTQGVTEIDFSFDATPVYFDARDPEGFPVGGQRTYLYDTVPEGRNHFSEGYGGGEGGPTPFYLHTGSWAVNVGPERGGPRGELLVDVPGDFEPIRLRTDGTETLPEDAASRITPCLEMVRVEYLGCLVERAVLGGGTKNGAPPAEPMTEAMTEPTTDSDFVSDAGFEMAEAGTQPSASVDDPLAGLAGAAFAYADGAGDVGLYVVVDDASEAATLVLVDGWCGGACAGLRGSVHRDEVYLATTEDVGETGASATEAGGHRFEIANFGGKARVFVTGPDGRTATLSFFDRLPL